MKKNIIVGTICFIAGYIARTATDIYFDLTTPLPEQGCAHQVGDVILNDNDDTPGEVPPPVKDDTDMGF